MALVVDGLRANLDLRWVRMDVKMWREEMRCFGVDHLCAGEKELDVSKKGIEENVLEVGVTRVLYILEVIGQTHLRLAEKTKAFFDASTAARLLGIFLGLWFVIFVRRWAR